MRSPTVSGAAGRGCDAVARAAMRETSRLHRLHPTAPPREVLDFAMQARAGQRIDFGDVAPSSEFGSFLTVALSPGCHLADWSALSGLDAEERMSLSHDLWRCMLWPQFTARYHIR